MQTCQVEGCERPVLVKARQLCKLHYHRWHATGQTGSAEPLRIDGSPDERWRRFISENESGCWLWTGSLDKHGYGQYDVRINGERKNWRAHRWVFSQLVRELADDETLDHLCRVHACVNPAHVEPVPHLVNVQRGNSGLHNRIKTHCPKGHQYTPENTKPGRSGRECRECVKTRARELMRRKRGTAPDAVANRDKTHCKNGHEFTPENTRLVKNGRECKTCRKAAVARHRAKLRAAAM